ncbi:MAG TPA: arsenic metallochaperone ArsD family protein, partial [Pyrinomonadaceae bacterium]|nr:arsenic metallochaperone ArsD family protein [Pyrinomonadaceae bacterium]
GNACLPLILINGQVASRGAYPLREQLALLTGVSINMASGNFTQISRTSRNIPVLQSEAQNCCEPGDGNSSCC